MNPLVKKILTGAGIAGSMDAVMNANHYGDWTPQRALNIPFNAFLGGRIGDKGVSTGRVLGEIVGKDVLLGLAPSVYALPDTIKNLTKNTNTIADAARNSSTDSLLSNTTKTVLGAGAIATGLYGIAALKKELARRRAEREHNTTGQGTVQITLPTEDENDSETVVNMPLEEFGLAARLRAGIKRDVKRRLRAGIEERTHHKTAFNMMNGMGQLPVGIKPIGGIEMKSGEEVQQPPPPPPAPAPTPPPQPTLTLSPVIKGVISRAKKNVGGVQTSVKRAELINPGQTATFGDTDRKSGLIAGAEDNGYFENRRQAKRYGLAFDDSAAYNQGAPTTLGEVPGYYGSKMVGGATKAVGGFLDDMHQDTSSQIEQAIRQHDVTGEAYKQLGDKFTMGRLGNALKQTWNSANSVNNVGYGLLSDATRWFSFGLVDHLPGANAKPQDYAVHRLNIQRRAAEARKAKLPHLGLTLGRKPTKPATPKPTPRKLPTPIPTPKPTPRKLSAPTTTPSISSGYRGGM